MVSKKYEHLNMLAQYRQSILKNPPLKNLFLELTLRCNERCIHCGSSCGEALCQELTLEQYKNLLDKVKKDFGTKELMLCITGGEPLLRSDFFEIMGYAHKLGFNWGMTSNGTLIDKKTAHKLRKCGMNTISVSIDGVRETHDAFRRSPGGYDAAIAGIHNLIEVGGFNHIQVTTVIHHQNIGELDEMYRIFENMDIDSWRITGIEPIGRAKQHKELMLTDEDHKYMLDFIRSKRKQAMPVTYGCCHYLGKDYEREVRDWYFLCNAGIYVASITSDGDICACLDIERRTELTQGNILRDDLKEVWENKFGIFRSDLSELNEKCRTCSEKKFCRGGSYHSWDYDKNEQQICFCGVLF